MKFFEILPALLAWLTLTMPFVFLWDYPSAVTTFIFFYTFLWFLRASEYGFFLIYAYRKLNKSLKIDWKNKLEKYNKNTTIHPKDVVHLIIIPTYKEELDMLSKTIENIRNCNFDKKNIIVTLGIEERAGKDAEVRAETLYNEFKDDFIDFIVTKHPQDLPNEVIGKGANINYACKKSIDIIKNKNIDINNILVTTLDADNIIHKDLLISLSIEFASHEDRHKKSFQPLPLFFNNIWDVPIINRVIGLSCGFWHMIEAGRPDRLRNFSSHSQALSSLIDMNFWDATTIVEDGRQYWKSYLHFNGDYEVVPIFLPIYQDAVLGKTYVKSLGNQFSQLKRWAWGSADVMYFTRGIFSKNTKLPFWKTFLQYFRLIEGHYMWSTAAIFLAFVPLVIHLIHVDPVIYSNSNIKHFIVVLSIIFNIALMGIVISIMLTFLLIPKPPKKYNRISILFQWMLLPITTIFFGSFPALLSQTQLALGKEQKFNVTDKVIKKK